MTKTIIDLRGLNYPFLTGVNTVTLHVLFSLIQSKKLNGGTDFTAYGLNKNRIPDLESKFRWIKPLLLSNLHTSLSQIEYVQDQIINILKFYSNIQQNNLEKYDIFYQTQPKLIGVPASCKFITTFHDLSAIKDFNHPKFKQKIQENRYTYQKLADRANKIIVSSYATGYDLVKTLNIDENKIKVVYQALPDWDYLKNNLNSDEANPNPSNYSGRKPFFLAVSAFEYRKNYHNLILGWYLLSKLDPSTFKNHELIIVGSMVDVNYYKYLQKLLIKLELKNVTFLTDVSNAEKQALLKNCLALVYTSLYEGFGFPILEAQKYGKSILTSNISSMPEIAGKSALCVNPLDSGQIAEGLSILARDSIFRSKLETESSLNLLRFSWGEYDQALEEILKLN